MGAAVDLLRRTTDRIITIVEFTSKVWIKNEDMTRALFPLSLAHLTVYIMILYLKQRFIDGI